jgi:hypothetical protein
MPLDDLVQELTQILDLMTIDSQRRVRSQIDRLRILALIKPKVAAWLIDFVDLFLDRHVGPGPLPNPASRASLLKDTVVDSTPPLVHPVHLKDLP